MILGINYIICILVSLGLSSLIYHVLYNFVNSTNIHELIIGPTILDSYNKNIDYLIFFIYILLFFIIFFAIKNINFRLNFKDFIKDFEFKLQINKDNFVFKILQSICTLFYFLLCPLNNHIYPILFGFVVLLVIVANFDIYSKKIFKNYAISPFAIIPLLLLLFGKSYNFTSSFIDNYHWGEKFTTFYMLNHYNYKLFEDINLIHGFMDIASGFLGHYIFLEDTLYSYMLGESLIFNLNLILSVLLGFFVFESCPVFIFGIFVNSFFFFNSYFLTALLMLKEKAIKIPCVWLSIYMILSFLLSAFWLPIGIFVTLSLLPLAIYLFFNMLKSKQYIKISFLFLLFLLLLFTFKSFIIHSYIYHSLSYPLTYANGFPQIKIREIFFTVIKIFSLIVAPCFVIEMVKSFKTKNLQLGFIYLFAFLLPIVAITYELTRIDYIMFLRIRFISFAYILILLPFIFTITKSAWLKYSKYIFAILMVILICLNLKNIPTWFDIRQVKENTISNIGTCSIDKEQQKSLENVKNMIDKYSNNGDYILDLTNNPLYYFYFDRKIPISIVAYFNFTSVKEEDVAINQLNKNKPKIIILRANNIIHDNIYPSLRINSIYHWILENNYKMIVDKSNVFLIKTDKKTSYTKNEQEILDDIFANKDLNQLPESWGKSINNFKLKDGYDLLYFEQNTKEPVNYVIKMKNSESVIKFNTKNANCVLVPLDNYPSWVLNKNEIEILKDKNIQIHNVKFYGRN